MSQYTIVDNYLPHELSVRLADSLMRSEDQFPWFVADGVVHTGDRQHSIYNYRFVHSFYAGGQIRSSHFQVIEPIIQRINPKVIERVKANLNPATDSRHVFDFHVDFTSRTLSAKTAIYYVNTNNGVTIFEDGTEINSVANRLLVFDQDTRHAGTTCTDEPVRCLINFNYIEKTLNRIR